MVGRAGLEPATNGLTGVISFAGGMGVVPVVNIVDLLAAGPRT
jgi:hypothetical protein